MVKRRDRSLNHNRVASICRKRLFAYVYWMRKNNHLWYPSCTFIKRIQRMTILFTLKPTMCFVGFGSIQSGGISLHKVQTKWKVAHNQSKAANEGATEYSCRKPEPWLDQKIELLGELGNAQTTKQCFRWEEHSNSLWAQNELFLHNVKLCFCVKAMLVCGLVPRHLYSIQWHYAHIHPFLLS